MRSTLALALLAFSSSPLHPALADDVQSPAQQLVRLKSLAGTWTGKAGLGGAAQETTVVWRVTSGGHAAMETIDPGTPHEMVTLYHLDGGKLVLTHYCAAGNQPTMRAVRSSGPDAIAFDFVRGSNMKPGDMHMHAARISFVGPDRLDTEWTSWQGGKPAGKMRFELTRQR
jgi:hypothetical protein